MANNFINIIFKNIPMNLESRKYILFFCSIGNVIVEIQANYVRITSPLSISTFAFNPFTCDSTNHYGLIKSALKHYFTTIILSYKIGTDIKPKSIVKYFSELFIKSFQLAQGDYFESLILDFKYSYNDSYWENLNTVHLLLTHEDGVESIIVPPLISFSGFKDIELILNNAMMDINRISTNIKLDDLISSTSEDSTIISHFFKNEITFFIFIFEFYSNRRESNQINLVYIQEVVNSHKILIQAMFKSFFEFIVNILSLDLYNKILEFDDISPNSYKNNSNENPTLNDICSFINQYFSIFQSYSPLATIYEDILKSDIKNDRLQECIVRILQKITNYSRLFKIIYELRMNDQAYYLYHRFNSLNLELNKKSSDYQLKKARVNFIIKYNKYPEFINYKDMIYTQKLLDILEVAFKDNKKIKIYLFEGFIIINEDSYNLNEHILLYYTSLALFNMKIFLFLEHSNFKSKIFSRIGNSKIWYFEAKIQIREASYEFKTTFYKAKFSSSFFNGVYISFDNDDKSDIIVTEADPQKDTSSSVKCKLCSDYDLNENKYK